MKYIQDTLIHDLGYPWEITDESRLFKDRIRLPIPCMQGARIGSTVFTNEFIKVKTPNLKGGGTTTDQGGGATTQGGGGGGRVQGTSQQ